MQQKCLCPNTNLPAQTVYPLQGGKVHPNFENQKKFPEKNFLASTTTRKIRWFHWWNPFLNPFTITEIFAILWPPCLLFPIGLRRNAASYYARRPILRTGQHLPCAAFSSLNISLCQRIGLRISAALLASIDADACYEVN